MIWPLAIGFCLVSGPKSMCWNGHQAGPVAGSCAAYHAGQDHVLRTYCDGPGTMRLRINGIAREIRGGTCEAVGGMPSFNAGVVTEMGATVSPDYVGIATKGMGPFRGAVLALRLDGKNYLLMENHGVMGPHGGTVDASGHSIGAGREAVTVSASFTC
jgi:hypothetical protein